MLFSELEQFLTDCIVKQVPFPMNPMTVVVDDFNDRVPQEHIEIPQLEFRHRVGNDVAMVIIIPKPSL